MKTVNCLIIAVIVLLASNLYAETHLTCDWNATDLATYNVTHYGIYEGDVFIEKKELDPVTGGMWYDLSNWECGNHVDVKATWINEYGESAYSPGIDFTLVCNEVEVTDAEVIPPEEDPVIENTSEVAVEPTQEFVEEPKPEPIIEKEIVDIEPHNEDEETPFVPVNTSKSSSGGGCFISTVFGG
jgi:hypothetical protein